MSPHTIPSHAEIVIIGGGIIGCSLAYHLSMLGKKDVILLEQGQLSCGTTWHAAGLVGQLRTHSSITRLIRYSTDLYSRLEQETGLATGWKACGSLSIARSKERMTALRRTLSSARAQGVEIEELSPDEASKIWPLMRIDDLQGAVWLPGDGKANPSDVTQALARGARSRGVQIFEKTRVMDFIKSGSRITAVQTDHGLIHCDTIAITAGQWSRQIGLKCGVAIPLHSAEHMYIVTGKMNGAHTDLPVMRDPDGYIYFKEEVGGLVMGGFEPNAKPWGSNGIPDKFEFQLLPDDWDQFEILMQNALHRVPSLENAEIKTFLNGPESFTPDNQFILGLAPEMDNIFVGAGFNSMGIASAGGAGKALAEWMIEGEPSLDLWPVDIRRFASFNNNPKWLHDRVKETLGLHYAMPWPNRELHSARPFRRSPLYDRLASKGAVFGSKMGWERANWFADDISGTETIYSYNRQNWFHKTAEEHIATRTSASLFDMSSFTKFMVIGSDAEAALQYLCANNVDCPIGRTVYTPLLNHRGGFESDLTVARLSQDQFMIVTGSAQSTRDMDWIKRHIPLHASNVQIFDITNTYSVLALMGPHSRHILSQLTHIDLSNSKFPFGSIQQISIGYANCFASRRSYMGELGWELYIPNEFTALVYDDLHKVGVEFGLRDAGYYAVESLRLEKAYRAWGRELTPDINPYEAGLGFAVQFKKPMDFIGRKALEQAKAKPIHQSIISILSQFPDCPPAWGGELILANGQPVGEITSAAYGYSLKGVIGLGHIKTIDEINSDWLISKKFEIEIAGNRHPIHVQLKPFYDHSNIFMYA